MKYRYSFTEIIYGSIEIEADHEPSRAYITRTIMEGNAHYEDTKYENIKLEETEKPTPTKERSHER